MILDLIKCHHYCISICENLWCDIGGMFPELYRLLLQMIKSILYSCFFSSGLVDSMNNFLLTSTLIYMCIYYVHSLLIMH